MDINTEFGLVGRGASVVVWPGAGCEVLFIYSQFIIKVGFKPPDPLPPLD